MVDDTLTAFRAAQQGNLSYFTTITEEYCHSGNSNTFWWSRKHEKSGDSLCHYATRHGQLTCLKLFYQNGADLEATNYDGKKPIHDAAQFCQADCLDFLLRHHVQVDCFKKSDWTPLMLACTKTSLKIVKKLIAAGADPLLKNKDGWNSFHIACRGGQIEMVKYIHQIQPDIWRTASHNGRTALHTAALHGHSAVTEYLLEMCQYPQDVSDTCGSTPLMDAVKSKSLEIVGVLVEKYMADVRKMDSVGRQVIHLAAQTGSVEILDYLITRHGICVDTPDASLRSPLHIAAQEGHVTVVEKLVKLGSDPGTVDSYGKTALDYAKSSRVLSCVQCLQSSTDR
ncbi:hypothetical protein ScPMuIL_009356 [Solemya velum]